MPVPLQIPVASTPVVEPTNGTFHRAWRLFLLTLANKLLGAAGVAAVSSPDIAATPAQIATTDIAALADPLVTSADADATYSANEVTLINELKVDVNALVTRQNLDAALLNEVKAKVNAMNTYLATIQTLSNEEKARFNELRDALNE